MNTRMYTVTFFITHPEKNFIFLRFVISFQKGLSSFTFILVQENETPTKLPENNSSETEYKEKEGTSQSRNSSVFQ